VMEFLFAAPTPRRHPRRPTTQPNRNATRIQTTPRAREPPSKTSRAALRDRKTKLGSQIITWRNSESRLGMCATKLQWLQHRLLSYSVAVTWPPNDLWSMEYTGGIEDRGPGEMPLWPSRAKKRRKKQPVAPPDAPPYRVVTSGRKQELDQEATPGRRKFLHMAGGRITPVLGFWT
jgi:hypothetical protein